MLIGALWGDLIVWLSDRLFVRSLIRSVACLLLFCLSVWLFAGLRVSASVFVNSVMCLMVCLSVWLIVCLYVGVFVCLIVRV